jgi:hypothetical protein
MTLHPAGRRSERRGKGTGQRGQEEAAAVHVGTLGRMRAKVNCRGAGRELEGSLGSAVAKSDDEEEEMLGVRMSRLHSPFPRRTR